MTETKRISIFLRKLHWLKIFGLFFHFRNNFFYIFSTKMDRDIIIIQPDFFFFKWTSQSAHSIVWCSCKICEHILCFVCEHIHFMWKTNLGDQYQIQLSSIHTQSQSLKTQCQMWIHINIHVRCEYTSLLAIKWPLVIKQPPPFLNFFFLSLAKAWQHANS